MLAVALRRRDAKESVTAIAIAMHLGLGRSTLYRRLPVYDEAVAPPENAPASSARPISDDLWCTTYSPEGAEVILDHDQD